MKKLLKNWQKPSVFLSFFVLGSFLLAGLVLAVTTNSNNNAPAQTVSLNETDFLVMDFNINVASDSNIAGTSISGGTAISTTKPVSWTDMRFYDYSGGGQWDSGGDWIGTDLDNDGRYTSQSDLLVSDGAWDYGTPTVAGTSLVTIEAADKVCTNSLASPSCVYQLVGRTSCGEGDDSAGDYTSLVGGVACDQDGDVMVLSSDNWSFRDGSSSAFEYDEDLYIERGGKGLTYSASADTTTAGTSPTGGTAITATKPASWSTTSFYDASGGGQWSSGNDWIGLDADNNNYYLDRLNTLTTELDGISSINALTDVTNVKFWLDNGNGNFETGSDTLLGTATTASSYDSGGSGWYANSLNRSLAAGTNRIFVSMTINAAPSNNEVIKAYIPQYVDSGSDGIWQLGDRGMFLNSRVLGNIYNTNVMTVDAIAPTMTMAMSDDELKVGDTALFTFTFSEPVTGFTNADITTMENGTMSAVSSSDGGTTWTSTFTPNSSVEDLGNIITVTMTGIYDVPGNPGVGTVNSGSYKIDTVRPTLVSATFSDTKLKIGDTATTTFTFSEAVSGFTSSDLTVPNGVISEPATGDGGITWTAILTPNSSVEDLTNEIVVDMSGVNDRRLSADSNTGTATSNSVNYEIDTISPTLSSATFSDAKLKIGDTAVTTFTFSEAVSGFTSADLTVPNGTIDEPATSDSGITWTATLTPATTTEDLSNMIVVDLSGINDKKLVTDSNTGAGTANSSNYEIDTIRPELSSLTFSDNQLKVGDTSTVTLIFSEVVSWFTDADLSADNATISALASTDNITWTFTLTPSADIEDSVNMISVNMAGLADSKLDTDDNNGLGTATSTNYEVDTKRPTLVSAIFDDSELKIGDTSTTTLTFSEAITGLTSADLSVQNGTVTEPQTSDNITWSLTLTPTSSVESLTNAITVSMTGVNDMKLTGDSNTGTGSTASDNYAIDTIRPTLAITLDDYELNIGATTTVSFTFSEEVVNFTNADITTIENGTLSAVSTANDIIYTSTFTPSASTTDMTNIIAVTLSGVDDDFLPNDYNSGAGIATSSNYKIDTVNATFNMQYYRDSALTSEIAGDSYLKAGTYYIKITANEALSASPTVTINAEGTNNDVTGGVTVNVSGNDYKYTRVITSDALAVGTDSEVISIDGYDALGNFSNDFAPLNLATKKIYNDTVAPVVNAGADKGTVRATFTQTGSATDTDGSGISSYSWTKQSGHYNPTFGSVSAAETTVTVNGGGPYVIVLTATDTAGNSASDTFSFTWGSVPSSGSVSAPSLGSGSVDTTVPISDTKSLGNLSAAGINVLGYVNSIINFNAINSQSKILNKYTLKIKEVNTVNKKIKLELQPGARELIIDVNEKKYLDLDNDGINDVLLVYNNLLVNRVDLTISQLSVAAEINETDDNSITNEPAKDPASDIDMQEVINKEKEATKNLDSRLTSRLAGKILLQVEEKGQAWYVEPISKARHFMGRPTDAFSMMRRFGLGISEANFTTFQSSGAPSRFSGRILLRVEENGEAYYVNPVDLKLYYLGRPADAFRIMRELALGINNVNIRQIPLAQ